MGKQPKPDPLSVDLVGVGARFDAWLGRTTDVVDAVRDYRDARNRITALTDAARKAQIADACERAVSQHQAYVSIRRRKIERVRRAPRTQRRLTSEAVRRASPALWDASRPRQVRLGIQGALPAVRLMPVRSVTVDALISSMDADKAALSAAKKREAESRALVVAVFEAVSEVTIWCGEPLRTTDGWVIGYTAQNVFSAARAAELAPSFRIDADTLTSDVVISASEYWRVVDATTDDDHDGQFGVE